MNYPTEWDLNLNGEAFNALKSDFNAVLRKTLTNMETKSSELAELTVKVKISLKKDKVPAGSDLPRDVVMPKFDHKVSSVMQIKDELTGSLGGNYELVWDGERGEYVMREIRDGQMNIFDAGYERTERYGDVIEAEYIPDESDLPALPGGEPLMLADAVEDDSEDLEKLRESCSKRFPDCACLSCRKFDCSCCSDHARDCKDSTDCIDYQNGGDGYEYEKPVKEDDDE